MATKSLAGLPSRLLASFTNRLTSSGSRQSPLTTTLLQLTPSTSQRLSPILSSLPVRPFSSTPAANKGGPRPKKKGPSGIPKPNKGGSMGLNAILARRGGGAGAPGKGLRGKLGSGSRAARMRNAGDPKIKILGTAIFKLRFVPPPLRMGRNRYLRHWTIHRAWQLHRRKLREARERELMQQYQCMVNACEELRLMRGPGLKGEGYLFRVAMEKKGVYRHGGVPIEYARPQTETPALEPWNHDWKLADATDKTPPSR